MTPTVATSQSHGQGFQCSEIYRTSDTLLRLSLHLLLPTAGCLAAGKKTILLSPFLASIHPFLLFINWPCFDSIARRTMSLASTSASLLRTCARQHTTARAAAAVVSCQHQRRGAAKSSFESPFTSAKIPDFSHYASKSSPKSNQVFSYFVAGTMGLVSAAGAKATVQGEH